MTEVVVKSSDLSVPYVDYYGSQRRREQNDEFFIPAFKPGNDLYRERYAEKEYKSWSKVVRAYKDASEDLERLSELQEALEEHIDFYMGSREDLGHGGDYRGIFYLLKREIDRGMLPGPEKMELAQGNANHTLKTACEVVTYK
jgi:hypothetical protein